MMEERRITEGEENNGGRGEQYCQASEASKTLSGLFN